VKLPKSPQTALFHSLPFCRPFLLPQFEASIPKSSSGRGVTSREPADASRSSLCTSKMQTGLASVPRLGTRLPELCGASGAPWLRNVAYLRLGARLTAKSRHGSSLPSTSSIRRRDSAASTGRSLNTVWIISLTGGRPTSGQPTKFVF
jgi:hypothetical protein